jgi:hypothetical protein
VRDGEESSRPNGFVCALRKKIRHCEGNTFGNSVYSITFPQKVGKGVGGLC